MSSTSQCNPSTFSMVCYTLSTSWDTTDTSFVSQYNPSRSGTLPPRPSTTLHILVHSLHAWDMTNVSTLFHYM